MKVVLVIAFTIFSSAAHAAPQCLNFDGDTYCLAWASFDGTTTSNEYLRAGEIVAWLKSEHGLGHGHANAIVAHVLATKDKL